MSVVDPIFGRTAVNAASSCGCTCTQTTPTAPSFNSVWTGQRDSGGGCACTCNTTIEYNLSINYDGAHNAVSYFIITSRPINGRRESYPAFPPSGVRKMIEECIHGKKYVIY